MKRLHRAPIRRWYYPKRKTADTAKQSLPDGGAEKKRNNTRKKFLLKFLSAVLLLMFAMIVFFDQLLCFAVVRFGSMATGLDITADKVELSIFNGYLKITNLHIKDPANDAKPQLAELSSFTLSWDKYELLKGKFVVHLADIRNLQLHGEISADGIFDLQKLLYVLFQTSSIIDYSKLDIHNVQIRNLMVTVSDLRQENNISGTGFYLRSLDISPKLGTVKLDDFQMFPSRNYHHNVAEADHVEMHFSPDMFNTVPLILKSADIRGVRLFADFKDNASSMNDMLGTFKHLLSDDQKQEAPMFQCQLEHFYLQDFSLGFWDIHQKNPIHGFGICFKQFSSNPAQGTINLEDLQITNPHIYTKPYMLTTAEISGKFRKENRKMLLEELEITQMHGFLEYRTQNNSNIHDVTDALCILFHHPLPCKSSTVAPKKKTEITVRYSIRNSSLTVLAPEQDLSKTIPYNNEDQKDQKFETSDEPFLTSLHSKAVDLENNCKDIQMLQNLTYAQEILEKAADSAEQTLKQIVDPLMTYAQEILENAPDSAEQTLKQIFVDPLPNKKQEN